MTPGPAPDTGVPATRAPAPAQDHRRGPRRRGAALDAAIFEATLAEIAETGYASLTMEHVAERARASKASLYRRWQDRVQLVLDAAYHVMPSNAAAPDTGSLREDILTTMRQLVRQLEGPAGLAIRGLLGETLQNPDVAAEVREYSRGNTTKVMREMVARAVARGECDPALVTDRRLEAGPAMLRQRFIFTDGPIRDEYLKEIVDEVVLPLFGITPVAAPDTRDPTGGKARVSGLGAVRGLRP
ncbi:TetR/AcrR family transcriptional regulator [Pseudarthrobacter sp. S9]|uniref:TetR/AcrR family transcriptional regulator n=1 Tax=Pseudarthrobacter sp. S9 TaxID=3418421 RepID=UPI003CFFECED